MSSVVLDKAKTIVYGARQKNYGTPEENHGRTAALWSAYLGIEITPRQVCALNILQKISRDVNRPVPDNPVDIAGYAENMGILAEGLPEPELSPFLADLKERVEARLRRKPEEDEAIEKGIVGEAVEAYEGLRVQRTLCGRCAKQSDTVMRVGDKILCIHCRDETR